MTKIKYLNEKKNVFKRGQSSEKICFFFIICKSSREMTSTSTSSTSLFLIRFLD